MLIEFFLKLKEGGVPVSVKEFLTLIEALAKRVAFGSMEEFYWLARASLVKDEKYYDRYDRVFAAYFKGIVEVDALAIVIPEEWLKKLAERNLSEEDRKLVESLGGWDKLMETLRKRLEEQKGRHQGGSKWIGTGGTSPFGARKALRVFVEASVLELPRILINGGRRGYLVGIAPNVLADLLGARAVRCAL